MVSLKRACAKSHRAACTIPNSNNVGVTCTNGTDVKANVTAGFTCVTGWRLKTSPPLPDTCIPCNNIKDSNNVALFCNNTGVCRACCSLQRCCLIPHHISFANPAATRTVQSRQFLRWVSVQAELLPLVQRLRYWRDFPIPEPMLRYAGATRHTASMGQFWSSGLALPFEHAADALCNLFSSLWAAVPAGPVRGVAVPEQYA